MQLTRTKKQPSRWPSDVEAVLDDFAREHFLRQHVRTTHDACEFGCDPDDADLDMMAAFHYDIGDK